MTSPRLKLTRGRVAVAGLSIFLVIWVWAIALLLWGAGGPNGLNMGADYSHTYSAIVALRHGQNPYDYHVLWRVQQSILKPLHLPFQRETPAVLIGTSPFYLWILQPLSWLPFQLSAVLYMFGSYALSGAAFFAVLNYFGWRRRLLPTALFLAAPQTIMAAYFGNTIDIVFLGIAFALPLLKRHPVLAGACLSMSVLKIPAAAPIAMLILLFEAPDRGRVIWGFLGCYAVRNVITVAVVGWQPLFGHFKGLLGFTQSIALQPNLASLSGIYVRNVGHAGRLGLEIASVAVASGLTGWWYLRSREQPQSGLLGAAWLWGLWMLATPYAHFIDEMVLVIPLVALLGKDGERVSRWPCIAALYLAAGSIFLFSAQPDGVQLLWLPLVGLTACFAAGIPIAKRNREAVARVALSVAGGGGALQLTRLMSPFPDNPLPVSHSMNVTEATTDS